MRIGTHMSCNGHTTMPKSSLFVFLIFKFSEKFSSPTSSNLSCSRCVIVGFKQLEKDSPKKLVLQLFVCVHDIFVYNIS